MAESAIELRIDGQVYAGWEEVAVTRAMDAACGAFSLTVTDRWYEQDMPWPISPGDAAEVRLDGETVITGYVDLSQPSLSATSHTISVQGRDKSADLVDCSAVHTPDEWHNIDLLRLGNILAAPFGVTVRAVSSVGDPFPLVKLQQGETALEALLRYARMRKLLVMPDGKGALLLTRTGTARASVDLVQGRNILEASGALDWSERFSDYTVKGQNNYSANTSGEDEAHVVATAKDPGVLRYRPLVIIGDCDSNMASALDRVTWEANTRLGKATSGTITVQGWRQGGTGALWQPNMLVRVRAPWLRLDGEMLIRQVAFKKGSGGTTTQLEIASPQAYEPEPPGKSKRHKKRGGDNHWDASVPEWFDSEGKSTGKGPDDGKP